MDDFCCSEWLCYDADGSAAAGASVLGDVTPPDVSSEKKDG